MTSINSGITPKQKQEINHVRDEVDQLVKDAKNGKFEDSKLFQAEMDLSNLLKEKNLPPSVKAKLQDALNSLKSMGTDNPTPNMGALFNAKYDIDSINEGKKT